MTDPMNKHLFTNITVLDCSGDEPFKGEVLVEGNEIVAVAREGESLQRDGAEIIDGGDGMTLMPGLVESHAHLSIENTDDLAALGRIPPEEHTLLTMHNARLYLDHGITSCISAASAKPRLDVVIRNAIESPSDLAELQELLGRMREQNLEAGKACLLYTSPSPRD